MKHYKENIELPMEGRWVRWQEGVCPNCGDWMFYNGLVLRCDCGREMRMTPEDQGAIDQPRLPENSHES